VSALSRNKGVTFERLVANMLTEATGTPWRRRVRQHQADSDVIADDPALQGISVECKHATRLCLPEWWRQAQEQAGQQVPVLIYRQTRGEIRVQLDAYYINATTWPVAGRHTITLGWETFAQWLREQIPVATRMTMETSNA
jgi:hypothetical protein